MCVAIYASVSTQRQERQQTIASQVSALRAWAAEAGHVLAEAHVFRDQGCNGCKISFADRGLLDANISGADHVAPLDALSGEIGRKRFRGAADRIDGQTLQAFAQLGRAQAFHDRL